VTSVTCSTAVVDKEKEHTMKRVNVVIPHRVDAIASRYLAEGAPAGALYRVLGEWALALLEEAPCLELEEAEALIRFLDAEGAAVTPLRHRDLESLISLIERLPTRILEDALVADLEEGAARRLAHRLAAMHPLERLGVLMKASWAREMRAGGRPAMRHPIEEPDAIIIARLVAPDCDASLRKEQR
jgi:hypothetical protein